MENKFDTMDGHLLHAEREWIRQMFAGTVHNIGNVITVAKLAVSELKESNAEKRELIDVILEEMLPTLEKHATDGTIGHFLTEDVQGKEFLDGMKALLEHKKHIMDDQHTTITSLDAKFDHVTEIINLQQRLIRGTGHSESVRCSTLLKDAIKMMDDSSVRHQVDVNTILTKDGIFSVDPSMVTQVFINLIKNAIEALDRVFDRQRAITIEVCHDHREDGDFLKTTFTDNGPGISEDNLARIFDFGFSTKNPGDYNRGVGLNYCKGTIEKFRGIITVDSTVGIGTTFSVWLPLSDDE